MLVRQDHARRPRYVEDREVDGDAQRGDAATLERPERGTGQPFHRLLVDNIIRSYPLRSRRQRLREAGLLTLTEMADRLGVCTDTVKKWNRAGIVSGQRYNDKHEMLYHPPDPDNPPTPHQGRRLSSRRPGQTQQAHESTRRGAV